MSGKSVWTQTESLISTHISKEETPHYILHVKLHSDKKKICLV